MRRWLRRIRGALGLGLTWAAAWVGFGTIFALVGGAGLSDLILRSAFLAGSAGGRGVVGDLSRGGFFVWTPVLAPPGTRVHITLREPGNREIDVRGEVRWNVGRFGRWSSLANR